MKKINFKNITKKIAGKEITVGAVLRSDGSTKITKTGFWRSLKPVFDREKCISCGICWTFCPEGCIYKDKKDKKFDANMDYCKGCGICANECPVKAITMIKEEK